MESVMQTVENHINYCDVLVEFKDVACPPAGDDGIKMSLSDYPNKAAFEEAAITALTEKHGYTLKGLRYKLINANFNSSSYFNSTDISARLWELFSMDIDDIDAVYAYYEAFEVEPRLGLLGPQAVLEHLNNESFFLGHHYTKSKMAEEYLSRLNDNEGILDLVMPYANLEGVADEIMKEKNVVVMHDHYFIKS